MSFSEKYERILNIVEADIKRVLERSFNMLSQEEWFGKKLRQFLDSPSKHIRAVVSFLYLKAYSIDIDERQILFQSIIEFIHNGSLIHDDVIDNSEIRRGKKSFNADFGEHLSVIAGDYVLSYALKHIYELKSFEILKLLADTLEKMCEGEVFQYNSRYKLPTIEEYIEKSYNKTGALFESAICGAELLAKQKINGYTKEFARNFGIAFQIKNDIKNVMQKSSDSDINNGIYTAAMIYAGAVENLSEGIEKAKILLDTYISRAELQLTFMPENIYKQAIIGLLEILRND